MWCSSTADVTCLNDDKVTWSELCHRYLTDLLVIGPTRRSRPTGQIKLCPSLECNRPLIDLLQHHHPTQSAASLFLSAVYSYHLDLVLSASQPHESGTPCLSTLLLNLHQVMHSFMRAHITAAVAFLPAYFSSHLYAGVLLCMHCVRSVGWKLGISSSYDLITSVRVMTWLHCVCVFRYTLCSFSTLTGCYKQKQFTKWIKVDIYQMQSWNESTHNTPSLFHTSDNRQLKTDMNQR